eukprot:5721686-Pleurochrysis_carterae.AAC.1
MLVPPLHFGRTLTLLLQHLYLPAAVVGLHLPVATERKPTSLPPRLRIQVAPDLLGLIRVGRRQMRN